MESTRKFEPKNGCSNLEERMHSRGRVNDSNASFALLPLGWLVNISYKEQTRLASTLWLRASSIRITRLSVRWIVPHSFILEGPEAPAPAEEVWGDTSGMTSVHSTSETVVILISPCKGTGLWIASNMTQFSAMALECLLSRGGQHVVSGGPEKEIILF